MGEDSLAPTPAQTQRLPGTALFGAICSEPVVVPASALSWVDTQWVDQHAVIIVRGTIVSLAALGLYRMARSIRLFAQFKSAQDIPPSFISANVRLRGYVHGVCADTGALQVQHAPIIRWPFTPNTPLPQGTGLVHVQLAGLQHNPALHPWLSTQLTHDHRRYTHVWFRLLRSANAAQTSVLCEVTAKRMPYVPFWSYNVNQTVVRRGVCQVSAVTDAAHVQAIQNCPAYAKLVDKLLVAEQVAERRGVGVWRRANLLDKARAVPRQVSEGVQQTSLYRTGAVLVDEGSKAAVALHNVGGIALVVLKGLYMIVVQSALMLYMFIMRMGQRSTNAAKRLYLISSNVKQRLTRLLPKRS